jgi:hypothetical protein
VKWGFFANCRNCDLGLHCARIVSGLPTMQEGPTLLRLSRRSAAARNEARLVAPSHDATARKN